MKTFKFRIYPNKNSISLLNTWFGQTRFVWNHYLSKSLSYVDRAKDLTILKKQEDNNASWGEFSVLLNYISVILVASKF